MIEVTPRATQLVAKHFKNSKRTPIRIFVKMGGCGIRSLGIMLEEPTVTDQVFDIDGFTYIVDKKLFRTILPVKVDADSICFRLSGNGFYPPTGCGTCPYLCGAKGGKRCSGVCGTCQDPCPTGYRLRSRRRKRA